MRPQRRKQRSRSLPPLLLVAMFALAVAAVFWRVTASAVELDLTGDTEITVEYGTDFRDPGASALFHESLILPGGQELPVHREGWVDTDRVGEYTLRYVAKATYRELFWHRTEVQEITRLVRVVDTQAPQILLTTKSGHYTLPGHAYEEEGFVALDDHDGDLTDQVVREERADAVVYTVTDASGNLAQVVRPIYYYDPVVPTVELLGGETVVLEYGQPYEELGCVALDNCDGDISQKVSVAGTVDVQTPGTYTLTYKATDTWGNSATTTRIVIVREPNSDDNKGKVIYLTFDDGPGRHTDRLLEMLRKYDVKVTFFVMNSDYLYLLPKMAADGHTIAVHTYSHVFSKVYDSDSAYFKDLNAIRDKVYEYTGQRPTILRFPGGSSNTISSSYSQGIMSRLVKAVEEKGYRYFDWNVDSNDAGGAATADEVFHNVVAGVVGRKYSVVLQHDVKGFSVDAVERIIQWGLANGYTFAGLTQDSPECEHYVRN